MTIKVLFFGIRASLDDNYGLLSDRLLGAVKHGPWRMAATPVVHMALSNAYWQRQGLRSITERYHSVRTS